MEETKGNEPVREAESGIGVTNAFTIINTVISVASLVLIAALCAHFGAFDRALDGLDYLIFR